MTIDDVVNQWIAQQQSADKHAELARVAFATGRFDEYWAEQGRLAQARLDAMHGDTDETGPAASS